MLIGPYIRRRAILSAEVVQRDSAAPTTAYSEGYRRKTESLRIYQYDSAAVGPAEVIILQFDGQVVQTAQVVEAQWENVRVCYYKGGRPKVRLLSNNRVFYTQRAPLVITRKTDFAVGDTVLMVGNSTASNPQPPARDTNVTNDIMRPARQTDRGLLMGLGHTKALVRTAYGGYVTVPYSQLKALKPKE